MCQHISVFLGVSGSFFFTLASRMLHATHTCCSFPSWCITRIFSTPDPLVQNSRSGSFASRFMELRNFLQDGLRRRRPRRRVRRGGMFPPRLLVTMNWYARDGEGAIGKISVGNQVWIATSLCLCPRVRSWCRYGETSRWDRCRRRTYLFISARISVSLARRIPQQVLVLSQSKNSVQASRQYRTGLPWAG